VFSHHFQEENKKRAPERRKNISEREKMCRQGKIVFFSSVVAVHSTSLQFVLKRRSNQTWF
jgi:hypothetical protein